VQWASKKLTPTEMRCRISEKEMLAVKWGIEKFSYELKARKFHLITDHKALEFIRNKPEFYNNILNRWCEAIQQYEFTIEYSKPVNLIKADALSRIHEKVKEPTKVNKGQ
ncbi:RNA-directed DNA polymerase, LTR Retrotransposon, partial [Trachipleistophora hominis]